MSAPRRIDELDGVRAIAIALVIGCHYRAFSPLLWGAGHLGWVGVNIFFVLSGYLITGNLMGLKDNPHAYRIFYGPTPGESKRVPHSYRISARSRWPPRPLRLVDTMSDNRTQ